jgi:hypothetical protein
MGNLGSKEDDKMNCGICGKPIMCWATRRVENGRYQYVHTSCNPNGVGAPENRTKLLGLHTPMLTRIGITGSQQRQQQILQGVSTVSKEMHDTAMAVIRKIG